MANQERSGKSRGQHQRRGRAPMGGVFLKYGHFYARYTLAGRAHCVNLRDDGGRNIFEREAALIAADRFLAPLRIRDELQRWRAVLAEVVGAEQRLADAEASIVNDKLKLAQAWASYCASPSSRFYRRSKARKLIDPPDANGGEKLRGAEQTHRNYFAEFIDFCQRKFPEISTLADVSERAAVEWFAWLTENKTADGANNRLLFLRGVYRALIADRRIIIARNPFSEIRKIPADHYRKRPLSREQIAALIDAAPRADFAMLIRIGYFTGLRLGDCATLRWAEIDQQRQIIERVPCKTARHLRGGEKITAKIAVNPQLAAHLARLARSGEFVLPKLAQEYLTHTSNFKSRLRKIFTRAGIVNAECRESGRKICHYGFHSLRYSFISHCAEAGVPQIVLLDNAGHTSAAISQHYQRLSDAAALQYRAVLSLPEAERSAN